MQSKKCPKIGKSRRWGSDSPPAFAKATAGRHPNPFFNQMFLHDHTIYITVFNMNNEFISHLETRNYQTKYRVQFITITDDVQDFIKKSGVTQGLIVIQTHHTTCGVWVNENEKNLVGPSEELGYESDLRKVLDSFASPILGYGHNDICDSRNVEGKRNTHLCEPDENGVIQECINGHAHAQALMIHPSITLIVEDGKWLRGMWQEIMLVELDHDRERSVSFLVQGI